MSDIRPAIKSFFIDYYDAWFPARWDATEVWERRGDLPPAKPDQFRMMEDAGLLTAEWGTIAMLRQRGHDPDTQVVIYWDPKGHAGRGKELVRLGDCWYPDMWASIYVPTERPEHTRELHIGNQIVVYRMWSDHEWQSNSGSDIGMELVDIEESDAYFRDFTWPLYAIEDRKSVV